MPSSNGSFSKGKYQMFKEIHLIYHGHLLSWLEDQHHEWTLGRVLWSSVYWGQPGPVVF